MVINLRWPSAKLSYQMSYKADWIIYVFPDLPGEEAEIKVSEYINFMELFKVLARRS